MYDITFFKKIEDSHFRNELLEILIQVDDEFVPPLSARNDSKQSNLKKNRKMSSIPEAYFKSLMDQNIILILDGNKVAAFGSFKSNYIHPDLSEIGKCNYFTTICVRKSYRGKGLAIKIYDYLLNELPEKYYNHSFCSRTWSTNTPSKNLFIKNGFKLIKTLKDHRGPGIDTLYYKIDI